MVSFLVTDVVVDAIVGIFTININFDNSSKKLAQVLMPPTTLLLLLLLPEDTNPFGVIQVGGCSFTGVFICVIIRHFVSFVHESFLNIKQRATTETVHTSLSCQRFGLFRRLILIARRGRNEEV